MAIYTPDVKMYYGSLDADHRLIPCPDISISTEFQYSNDTIIGYTYVINFNGVVTGLDLRDTDYGEEYPEPSEYGMGSVADHIHKLRRILSQNGNMLQIVDGASNAHILKARGGILRSLEFNESNNNWYHFANFTASIEFNSIDFMSAVDTCGASFLDASTFSTDGILDINKFKVKTFNDSWSFSFNENESYARVQSIDNNNNLNLNNVSFNIQYNINAVGKNYYTYTEGGSTSENTKLLPAWEQAKNFVQYRLYHQVTNLINSVLKNSYPPSGCFSTDGLDNLHEPGGFEDGLLSSLSDAIYKIYNEKITCDVSESEGSFSATYSAIISTTLGNNNWSDNASVHTVSKSINTTNTPEGKTTTTISLNGKIQGLIEGGLIRVPGPLTLPETGTILISNGSSQSAYDNAKIVLDKIYNPNDYNAGMGTTGKKDLKTNYKAVLGITMDALGVSPSPDDQVPDPPHPLSLNFTHDYVGGNIGYTAEYNSDNICGKKYAQISIQTNNPNKIIATFNIPNSNSCPIIQELGTFTAKRVAITIQGTDNSDIGQPSGIDLPSLIQCNSCYDEGYFPIGLPVGDYILTQKQYTNNPIDGSYTINLGYICSTGCDI
jgi:hypothetical protein